MADAGNEIHGGLEEKWIVGFWLWLVVCMRVGKLTRVRGSVDVDHYDNVVYNMKSQAGSVFNREYIPMLYVHRSTQNTIKVFKFDKDLISVLCVIPCAKMHMHSLSLSLFHVC